MSSPGQPDPNNNRSTLPDDSIGVNNPQTNIPDPAYYYPDGSTVFLVEGVLFKVPLCLLLPYWRLRLTVALFYVAKLQASLILPPSSVSSTPGDGSRRYPTGVDNLPRQLTDSSGANPIVLSNVTASQFRNYLFALLGRSVVFTT